MTSKPAGNTPDGADRSADRKPREVKGDLIERLRERAATKAPGDHYTFKDLRLDDEAATALAAQDARIKELEEALHKAHVYLERHGIGEMHRDALMAARAVLTNMPMEKMK